MSRPGGAVLDALADGLRRRAEEQRRAEERLADFAFTERTAGAAPGPAGAAPAGATPATGRAWRYHVGRALRAAGDLGVLDLLETLRGGPRAVAEVAAGAPFGGDRVATADWLGGLAAAGFVTREIEADRVALAPLGAAVLDLVEALEERLLGAAPGAPAAADLG